MVFAYCPCCRQDKDLTEHHVKKTEKKIGLCDSCHKIVEAYINYLYEHKIMNLKDNLWDSNIQKDDLSKGIKLDRDK